MWSAVLSKEIREQVRTYRLLILAATFVVFGFLSPLLAKVGPELMQRFDTGEMIIQMPTPTTAFALAQYVKNLTQFGVLLVILLTMGAVAREKDKGTAAMILSKPVARSSFLMAKFVAISLSFLVSLALAAAAAYIYTVILFGSLDGVLFTKINLLLAFFLLVFIAITLLCSTLVTSQVAAGGLAFGVLIISTALGSLPRVGRYAPGAVIAWTNRLAAGDSSDAWPAVTVSLAIVILSLLAAWPVFERQEL